MNFPTYTIRIETILGENEEHDKSFFEYLDLYSIDYVVCEGHSEFPLVEYTGGPVALKNMLRERFGFELEDIQSLYPQLN